MIPIISSILGIATKFIPDQTKLAELEAELNSKMEDTLQKAVDSDKEVRLAEMRQGGIASKWRPIAALSIFATLFLHWFLIPVLEIATVYFETGKEVYIVAPLPVEFYGLAGAFVSIYAFGRSQEKKIFNMMRGK
jgi:hypothetical protein